ncbi:MAG: DUF1553 domain-containing protein, partial [Planctomycetaceae bacterium]|nr:DUF1553 domain-containing protein [Planctomycetaceae bacterium]
ENPLTARVIVNRQWAALFGRGLVETIEDFGVQGTAPSHPELLDWLAWQWIHADYWSMKQLHRRLVMSRTYRQSSVGRADAAAVDPGHRLLAGSTRFRLEAEILRDTLVKAAGVLSLKAGGPPVRPLQPDGITEVTFGSPKWNADSGENRYRRSLYTFQKRTAPFAMFAAFDAPSGESCIVKRSRSNSPLQALTLLNDVMLTDLAQVTGRELAAMEDGESEKLTLLFRRLLTRYPDDQELHAMQMFTVEQRQRFSGDPAGAAALMGTTAPNDGSSEELMQITEQAVWTSVARAVFCLDEVQTRP